MPWLKLRPFLPLEVFEKGLEPPVWNSGWQLLFAGDLCFFHVGSHDRTKNFWAPLKTRQTKGGVDPPTPPLDPPPLLTGTLGAHSRCIASVPASPQPHPQADPHRRCCRSLFEKDKLVLAFLVAARVMDVDRTEFRFLLTGGVETDAGAESPVSWLPVKTWQYLHRLEQILPQANLATSLAQHSAAWRRVYDSPRPHEVCTAYVYINPQQPRPCANPRPTNALSTEHFRSDRIFFWTKLGTGFRD